MAEWQALAISVAIEVPVILLLALYRPAGGRGLPATALASAIATAVTHPQLWAAALWAYPRWGYRPSIIALEAMVVVVEGALIAFIAGLRPRTALLFSLAANFTSFSVGKLVFG